MPSRGEHPAPRRSNLAWLSSTALLLLIHTVVALGCSGSPKYTLPIAGNITRLMLQQLPQVSLVQQERDSGSSDAPMQLELQAWGDVPLESAVTLAVHQGTAILSAQGGGVAAHTAAAALCLTVAMPRTMNMNGSLPLTGIAVGSGTNLYLGALNRTAALSALDVVVAGGGSLWGDERTSFALSSLNLSIAAASDDGSGSSGDSESAGTATTAVDLRVRPSLCSVGNLNVHATVSGGSSSSSGYDAAASGGSQQPPLPPIFTYTGLADSASVVVAAPSAAAGSIEAAAAAVMPSQPVVLGPVLRSAWLQRGDGGNVTLMGGPELRISSSMAGGGRVRFVAARSCDVSSSSSSTRVPAGSAPTAPHTAYSTRSADDVATFAAAAPSVAPVSASENAILDAAVKGKAAVGACTRVVVEPWTQSSDVFSPSGAVDDTWSNAGNAIHSSGNKTVSSSSSSSDSGSEGGADGEKSPAVGQKVFPPWAVPRRECVWWQPYERRVSWTAAHGALANQSACGWKSSGSGSGSRSCQGESSKGGGGNEAKQEGAAAAPSTAPASTSKTTKKAGSGGEAAAAADVVFLGDSITEQYVGTQCGAPFPGDDGQNRVFNRMVRSVHSNARVLAIAGDTSANLMWRLVNGEGPDASTRVAVMLIGTNDLGNAHERFGGDHAAMLATAARTADQIEAIIDHLMSAQSKSGNGSSNYRSSSGSSRPCSTGAPSEGTAKMRQLPSTQQHQQQQKEKQQGGGKRQRQAEEEEQAQQGKGTAREKQQRKGNDGSGGESSGLHVLLLGLLPRLVSNKDRSLQHSPFTPVIASLNARLEAYTTYGKHAARVSFLDCGRSLVTNVTTRAGMNVARAGAVAEGRGGSSGSGGGSSGSGGGGGGGGRVSSSSGGKANSGGQKGWSKYAALGDDGGMSGKLWSGEGQVLAASDFGDGLHPTRRGTEKLLGCIMTRVEEILGHV